MDIKRNALVAEHISTPSAPWYVYLLADPRTEEPEPFYVGKGRGERFRSHGDAALLGATEGENGTVRRAKLDRIAAIRKDHMEPIIVFARIRIPSEEQAYQLEATLIDVLDTFRTPLTNVVRGHDTESGIARLDDLELALTAPVLTTATPAILVRLYPWKDEFDEETGRAGHGYRPDMSDEELMASVSSWWPTKHLKKVAQHDYVVAVYRDITRGVWSVVSDSFRPWKRPDEAPRFRFDLTPAPKDVVDAFTRKRVPVQRADGRRVFGTQGAIFYWP